MVKSTIKVTFVIIASFLILACNAINQVDRIQHQDNPGSEQTELKEER